MCKYEYKKFDVCGDHFIQVYDFCDQALWKAGAHGVLQICTPDILTRSLEWPGPNDLEPPLVTDFTSYDGFCDACVVKYMLPPTIPTKTNSDHRLDYQTDPSTFDPHSLAPYISARCVVARIPDLLRMNNQFVGLQNDQGPYIAFPTVVERMTWTELRNRMPFKITGVMEDGCHLSHTEVLEQLKISGGVSYWDRYRLSKAVVAGINLRAVYTLLFKPRGISLVDYDAILKRLRADAIQILTKKAEAVREQEVLEEQRKASDISTLTSLETTPKLSGLNLDPPNQSSTHAKTSAKHSTNKTATSAYEAEQSADEEVITPSPAPRLSVAGRAKTKNRGSLVPPSMGLADPSRQIAEQEQKTAERRCTVEQKRQRKPASVGSGSRVTAQPLLGEDPLIAVEQTSEETTVGKQTASNTTAGEFAGTFSGNAAPAVGQVYNGTAGGPAGRHAELQAAVVRRSAAGHSDSGAHPPKGYESAPLHRGTKRSFETSNATGTQQPHDAKQSHQAQQPHVVQQNHAVPIAAAIQGFWQQQYVNSILPTLPPETIQELVQSTGHPLFQDAAAALSRPRLPAHADGRQQYVNGLPQPPRTPIQPSRRGSQKLANGLPQLPQAPARPPQQLANGLPRLPPRRSYQSLQQGAQHYQGAAPLRDASQYIARMREAPPVPRVGNGDEDLQLSSRGEWQNSNRKRRAR